MRMSSPLSDRSDMDGVAAIVVTFHPEVHRFKMVLDALPARVQLIVVDNNSPPPILEGIRQALGERDGVKLLCNSSNVGLAAAINRGAAAASAEHAKFLLLMDQDSVPCGDAVQRLYEAFLELERAGVAVGGVGPRLKDASTGLEHGFHTIHGWRWERVYPEPRDIFPVRCANLNGSGTFVRTSTFLQLGGLDESLFIDHVDTDWSFRLSHLGFQLFGIPDAIFNHEMGESGKRFWLLGWRVWPVRSPLRHYYLFRNAIMLLRRSYVPFVWKFWAVVKLGATLMVHGILDPRRTDQLRQMCKGLHDGLRCAR